MSNVKIMSEIYESDENMNELDEDEIELDDDDSFKGVVRKWGN